VADWLYAEIITTRADLFFSGWHWFTIGMLTAWVIAIFSLRPR